MMNDVLYVKDSKTNYLFRGFISYSFPLQTDNFTFDFGCKL